MSQDPDELQSLGRLFELCCSQRQEVVDFFDSCATSPLADFLDTILDIDEIPTKPCPQRAASFLSLPGELRNEIFALAGPICSRQQIRDVAELPAAIVNEWNSFCEDTPVFNLDKCPAEDRAPLLQTWLDRLKWSAADDIRRLSFCFTGFTVDIASDEEGIILDEIQVKVENVPADTEENGKWLRYQLSQIKRYKQWRQYIQTMWKGALFKLIPMVHMDDLDEWDSWRLEYCEEWLHMQVCEECEWATQMIDLSTIYCALSAVQIPKQVISTRPAPRRDILARISCCYDPIAY